MTKTYTRPTLACFGTVADLTQGKTTTGTDSTIGGQTQQGEFCVEDTASRDCVAFQP